MAQPEGLVFTPATLKAAEANITWPVTDLQETLRESTRPRSPKDERSERVVLDLPAFFRDVLGWSDDFVVSGPDVPASLRVTLDDRTPLAPAHAVRSADEEGAFVVLVGEAGTVCGDLDAASDDKRWTASPHQKFERVMAEREAKEAAEADHAARARSLPERSAGPRTRRRSRSRSPRPRNN
jgi:hypothetical protein